LSDYRANEQEREFYPGADGGGSDDDDDDGGGGSVNLVVVDASLPSTSPPSFNLHPSFAFSP
jgi:hypothetical protein